MLTRSVSNDQLSYTAPYIPFEAEKEKSTEFNLVNRTLYVPTMPQVSSSAFFLPDQISTSIHLVGNNGPEYEKDIEMCHEENDDESWNELMDVEETCEEKEADSLNESHRMFSIEMLPSEILTLIFRYLDTKSYSRAAGVCLSWRQLAASPWLWWNRCNVVWDHLLYISQRSSQVCHEILASQIYEKKYSTRVSLLLETLTELSEESHIRLKNSTVAHYVVDCYYHIVNVLLSQLYESYRILCRIKAKLTKITVNFDILDLSIRRYMHQLAYMFPILSPEIPKPFADSCFLPPTSIDDASSIIKDDGARNVWEKDVGRNVHCVDFAWFYEEVLLKRFPRFALDDVFRDTFQFFVNFPRDDMMTTYKWAVIIDQFGPFEEFPENFRKYACGNGFLGLINLVEADAHLTLPNMFLIRFSRKEPEKLTFSFKVSVNENQLACRHKRKPCGVPISQYIAQNFNPKKYFPVQERLEGHATQFASLEEYCESTGYLIIGRSRMLSDSME